MGLSNYQRAIETQKKRKEEKEKNPSSTKTRLKGSDISKKREYEKIIDFDTFQTDLQSTGETVQNLFGGWQTKETMDNTRLSVQNMQTRINAYQEYQKMFGGADLSELASAYDEILGGWDERTNIYGQYKNAEAYDRDVRNSELSDKFRVKTGTDAETGEDIYRGLTYDEVQEKLNNYRFSSNGIQQFLKEHGYRVENNNLSILNNNRLQNGNLITQGRNARNSGGLLPPIGTSGTPLYQQSVTDILGKFLPANDILTNAKKRTSPLDSMQSKLNQENNVPLKLHPVEERELVDKLIAYRPEEAAGLFQDTNAYEEYKFLSEYLGYTNLTDFDKAVKNAAYKNTDYYKKLETERNKYALDHVFDRYAHYMEQEDFAEKSVYDPKLTTGYSYFDDFYEFLNSDDSRRAEMVERFSNYTTETVIPTSTQSPFVTHSLDQATEDEIKVFNLLAREASMTGDTSKLSDYIISMSSNWNKRASDNIVSDLTEFAGEGPLQAALSSLISIPMKMGGSVLGAVETAMGNPYGTYSTLNRAGNAIRAEVGSYIAENTEGFEIFGQNIPEFLYHTGMSIADSSVGATSFGKFNAFIMGSGAAQQKALELIEAGESNDKIFWTAVATGAAEAGFEYISLDHLFKMKTPGTRVAAWKAALSQGGIELSEEINTSLTNFMTDTLIRGKSSDLFKMYEDLKRRGYSTKEINKEIAMYVGSEVAWSGVGGFISGGTMGGSKIAKSYHNAKAIGSNIRANERIPDIVNTAQLTPQESDAYKLYTEYAKKSNGENFTDGQLGALYSSIEIEAINTLNSKTATAEQKAAAQKTLNDLAAYSQETSVKRMGKKAIKELYGTDNAEAIISEALERGEGTESHRIATELKTKVENGGKITANELATLVDANESSYKTDIKGEAVAILNELGETENAELVADAIAKKSMGERLTTQESEILEKSAYGNRVYNEINNEDVVAYTENMSASEKNLFLSVYDSSQDIEAFKNSYQLVSDYIKGDFTTDYILNHRGVLTPSQVQQILQTKITNKDITFENAISELKAKHKGSPFIRGTFDDSIIDYENKGTKGKVQWNSLDSKQKNAIVLIGSFATENGIDVELISDGEERGINGAFEIQGNKILIDVYAGMSKNTFNFDNLILPTLSHELVHWMRLKAPQLYRQYAEYVFETLKMSSGLTENEILERRRAKLKKSHPNENFSDEYVREEVVARASEDTLSNSNTMRDFVETLSEKEQKTFIGKIKEIFTKLKEWFNSYITKNRSNAEEAQYIRAMQDRIDEQIKLFDKMLESAIETNQALKKEGINVADLINGISEDGTTIVGKNNLQMSERTYAEGGRDFLINWLSEQSDLSETDKKDIVEQTDAIAKLMRDIRENNELPDYARWASTDVVKDENGDKVLSVIVKNGDYAMNVDFSQVCKKRVALNAVLNAMVQSGDLNAYILTETDVAELNAIIKKHDFEIACALCFVDSKRYRVGGWAESFCEGTDKKKNGKMVHQYGFNEMVRSLIPKGSNIQVDEFNFTNREIVGQPTKNLLSEMDDSQLDFTLIDEIMEKEYKDDGGKSSDLYSYAKAIKDNKSLRKILNPAEIISSIGLDAIRLENKDLYRLLNRHQGTARPKFSHDTVAYTNDILTSSKFSAEKAKYVGGVRCQSFSDFMANMVFDYVQFVSELSAKELTAHSYTKEPLFVKLFGLTGMKINMSLVPKAVQMTPAQQEYFAILKDPTANKRSKEYQKAKRDYAKLTENAGLDENGNYIWEDETFPYDVAMELVVDPRYSANCGTIAVGISENHILKLLADENISMVIPYHKSSLNSDVAKMRNIDLYVDFTNRQNTRFANGKKLDKVPDFDFYGDLYGKDGKEGTHDPKKTADNYLKWCDENNYIPKFEKSRIGRRFRDNPNYYKLLIDFRVYDTDGTYREQQPVKPIYPENAEFKDLILNGVKDKNGKVYGGLKQQQGTSDRLSAESKQIVDEFRETLKNKYGKDVLGTKNSDRESEYMSVAERGDTKTAQKMVDEYAIEQGFDVDEDGSPDLLFHGTDSFGFTKIDTSESDDGTTFWATPNMGVAGSYYEGSNYKVREIGKDKVSPKGKKIEYFNSMETMINAAKPFSADLNMDLSKVKFVKEQDVMKKAKKPMQKAVFASEVVLNGNYNNDIKKIAENVINASKQGTYDAWAKAINHSKWQQYEDTTGVDFSKIDLEDNFNINKSDISKVTQVEPDVFKMMYHIGDVLDALGNDDFAKLNGNTIDKQDIALPYNDMVAEKGIYGFYHKQNNPFIYDCKGSAWDKINVPNEAKGYFSKDTVTTRELAEWAFSNGYDAIKLDNVVDIGGYALKEARNPATVWAFKNPESQLKSADPITYDDNGNVIPLSQRFNPENKDIRYSAREDTEFNTLTDDQQDFFKDSKARDRNGRLLVLYHGSANGGFTIFDPFESDDHISLFFTNSRDVAETYADSSKEIKPNGVSNQKGVYSVYANIKNPYVVDAKGANWNKIHTRFNPFHKTTREIVKMAKKKGYDGVIFKNLVDVKTYDNNNKRSLQPSTVVVAFRSEQIKSITNKHPTSDIDIRYSDRDSEGNTLSKEQQEFFKDSKVRDKNGNLLVVRHGTSEDFHIFDFSKAGKNGKAEGAGFYFSDDKEITKMYGGIQKEVYLNITKPMYNNKRTVKKAELIKFTNALIDFDSNKWESTWQDSFISNYVNTYEFQKSRRYAVQEFVNQIWEYNDNDQDLIFEIARADGRTYENSTMKEFYDILTESIGYDGIIAEWTHSEGKSNVYVTFNSEQSKYTSNTKPTKNLDMRYADREDFTDEEYNKLVSKKPINVSKVDWAKVNSRRTIKYADFSEENIPMLDLIKLAEYNRINEAYDYIIRNNDKYSFSIISKRRVSPEKSKVLKERKEIYEGINRQNVRNENIGGINRRSDNSFGYRGTIREDEPSIRQSSKSDIDNDFRESNSNSGTRVKLSDREEVSVYDKMGETERLIKENESLKADIDRLKERLKIERQVTHGNYFNENQLNAVAGHIRKIAGSTYAKPELVSQLKEVYSYIAHSKELNWEDLFAKCYDVAENVLYETKPIKVADEFSKMVLNEIRGTRISLNDKQKQEARYRFGDKYRNAFMGKVIIANDGTPLDVKWNEWASDYPDLFDKSLNDADQINKLYDVYDDLRDLSETIVEYDTKEQTRWLAREIYNQYWNVSPIRTTADKYDKQIKRLNFEHRRAMQEFRTEYEERLKTQHTKDMEKSKELLRKLRERKDKEIAEVKKLGKERMDAYKENAERKVKIQNITANALTLNKWLVKNSKDEHIHEAMKGPVISLLNAIDFSSKRLLDKNMPTQKDISLSKSLSKVKDMMVDATNGKEELIALYGHDMDEDIAKLYESVDDIMRSVGDNEFVLNKMNLEELHTLDKLVKTVKHAVTQMNTFHTVQHRKGIANLSQEGINYLDSLGEQIEHSGLRGKLDNMLKWNNTVPYYAFKRLGDAGGKVFSALQDGWDKLAFNSKQITDYANELYTNKEVREWSENTESFDLLQPNGTKRSFKMTKAQIMALHCVSKQEDAIRHLLTQGMTLAEFDSKGKLIKEKKNILLTANDIAIITGTLSQRELEVADKLQEFMNTVCSDWGNEVSMQRFGVKMFTNPDYFPIKVSPATITKEEPADVRDTSLFRLLNMSFTKSRNEYATQSIEIGNVFDIFAQHTSDMAKYNALALPVLDAYRWYSYKGKTDLGNEYSTYASLENALGKDSVKYFTTFLKDLNGSQNVARDNFGSNFFRNAKIAAVAYNLRTILLQPTSYLRASAVIDNKYLVRAFAHKPKIDKAEKYCGIAQWKALGYYDVNISKGLTDKIKHADTWKDKAIENSMKGMGKADSITIGYLWNACELEIRETRKDLKVGSEEFYETIGKRLRDVIYATQVVDSTMTRSQMMRSPDGWDKMLTSFMSEPTLSYNMLQDAVYTAKLDQRKDGKEEAWRKNKKRIGRIFKTYIATNVLCAIVEAGFDAFRDDDDDEAEEFMNLFIKNFAEDMSIIGKIPYLKEITSAMSGYGSSRTDTQWMVSMVNAAKSWVKILSGDGDGEGHKAMKHTLRAFSDISGLAFYNLYRDSKSALDKLGIISAEELEELWDDLFG